MKKDPRRRKENVQSQVLAHRFVKTDLATGTLVIKRDANIASDASHVFMATRLARSVFSLP